MSFILFLIHMQKLTTILIRMILITVLAIVIVLLINLFSNKEDVDTQDTQRLTGDTEMITGSMQEEDPTPIQEEIMSQEQQEALIEEYIRENISELSPEPEVLGGTFYVTSITFSDLWEWEVQYEDGHIALTADFIYAIDESRDVVQIELLNVRD